VTRLVVASGSRHKVAELAQLLADAQPGLDVVGLAAFEDAPTIAETADSFAGNATLKARGIADWLRGRGEPGQTWVLADDSGLCVDALDGSPGVRSARFAGDDATDEANNARLVETFRELGVRSSPGHYVCVLALTRVGDDAVHLYRGRWDVDVRSEARGTGGFGYDPHAWLETGHTVAELARTEKSSVSHRGRALRALCATWPE
jgi:XTP/dITP diphosphohydrolase